MCTLENGMDLQAVANFLTSKKTICLLKIGCDRVVDGLFRNGGKLMSTTLENCTVLALKKTVCL